jgi:tetratricopeptide (TPR) repeat protein
LLLHGGSGDLGAEPQSASAPASGLSEQLARARTLIAAGSYPEAVALLEGTIARHPDDADARLLIGTALALLPSRGEALEQLQAAVRLRPDSAPAHDALGMAYSRFVEPELARRAFERAVELDPGLVRARVHLALNLAGRGDAEAALEQLAAAIAGAGDAPEAAYAHYVTGLIHSERDEPEPAAEAFEKAVALRPDDAAALLQLGTARRRLLDHAGSLQAFRRAVELTPADARARYELGRELLEADQPAEAVTHLRAALSSSPDDRSALYSLARALQLDGRPEEARELLARLREIAGRSGLDDQSTFEAGRLNNAGIELEQSGRLAAAVERYRAALELDPLNPVFRRNLALALCRLGEWSEGARELEEVLRLDPDDEQASRALYIALEKAGRPEAR